MTLIQDGAKDCVYITKQAVTTEDGKSYVNLKSADGSSVKTEVTTGYSDGQYIEIQSGLNEGDVCLAESALGGGKSGSSSGSSGMPDMGDFDAEDMSMPDGFDSSDMPSGGEAPEGFGGGDFGGGMAGGPQ